MTEAEERGEGQIRTPGSGHGQQRLITFSPFAHVTSPTS